ncbi:hypothetical protein KP509_35G007300 [Ceratopteris richardii]|nr:hypothetical protein KP509_35G007300 [Ceratopteris richardii]
MLPENAKELLFTLEELKKATSNFSPACEIGQGGYGVVYKGRLTDGREVAIKREIQEKESSNERSSFDFSCELSLLAGVEHFNLVKLLGYCDGNNERILVQEYVCNGTLRHHLDCERGVVLDFPKRLDIAIDVAHALTYLHFHAERPIIHRDIKSTNVLLTRNFRAKLADFGFAQGGIYKKGDMHISKQVKGTAGYLDPEYLKSLQLSSKSDVYSFGILLVEILTGRHPIEPHRPADQRTTILWAYKNYLKGNLTDILDLKLEKSKAMELVARKVFNLAFQCSAPIMDERPDMKQVGEYLWAFRREYQALQDQKVSASLSQNGS